MMANLTADAVRGVSKTLFDRLFPGQFDDGDSSLPTGQRLGIPVSYLTDRSIFLEKPIGELISVRSSHSTTLQYVYYDDP